MRRVRSHQHNVRFLFLTITFVRTTGLVFSPLSASKKKVRGLKLCLSNGLFADQQAAMAREAESERILFAGTETELKIPRAVVEASSLSSDALKKTEKRRQQKKAGTGFARVKKKTETIDPQENPVTIARAQSLIKEGVLRIPNALKRETALSLRECVINELEKARTIVKNDPTKSMSLFHAREEQDLRSFLLIPFQSDTSIDQCPIAIAVQELFSSGAGLGDLYYHLYGPKAMLHDFYALRTEPGSLRQPIHYDTPITKKKTGPLYATFIALQDISRSMGPTVFLPRTHRYDATSSNLPGRKDFDEGITDGRRAEFLTHFAKPQFAQLQAGDLVIFDMRILHFGEANSSTQGSTRYLLNLTFRKKDADAMDLGHIPCLRPSYVNKFNFDNVRSGSIFGAV